MEEKIIYVAKDGAEFEDEEECMTYELLNDFKPFISKIRFYDENRIPVSIIEGLDDIYYIVVNEASEDLYDFLFRFFKESGYDSPWENLEFKEGLYYYTTIGGFHGKWLSWEEEMTKLEDIGEYFQMFIENS